MRVGHMMAALGPALLTVACAGGRPSTRLPDSQERMREAVHALERDDFPGAMQQLAAVASSCREAHPERQALLLLAAAELDTGNPEGSPTAAAGLAERYLLLADAAPDERILARTLYRVATHLETLAPHPQDGGGTPEQLGPLEACPSPDPIDDTILTLALGSAAAPWLLDLESDRQALRRRVEELEAELARIKELLTSSADSPEPER